MRIKLIDSALLCLFIMQITIDIWAICTAPWYGKMYAVITLAAITGAIVLAWRKK